MPETATLPIFTKTKFWLFAFLISFVVGLLSFLFTGPRFITPKYTAECVFFVPLTLLSKHIEQQGIGFAEEVEIDAHIQILKSRALKDSLLSEFPSLKDESKNPFGLLDDWVAIAKTRYGSVAVSVTHRDAQFAADLANAIVALGDNIKEAILFDNRKEMFAYYRDMYMDLERESQLLENQLDSIRENNFGNTSSAYKINTLFVGVVNDLNYYKSQYAKQKKGMESSLPQSYVISRAEPPLKPSSPKRLMWFALSSVFSLVVVITWGSISK
ncbi:MAG: hypothetical protein LAT76_11415 [Schleiferiaceae bacterium]|nr:hypothetical protein [Schleiferiaceae bacterium]